MTATVLWIIAAILVIVGIVQLFQGQIILGIVLIVVGCLVGPGGYSIFPTERVTPPPRPPAAVRPTEGLLPADRVSNPSVQVHGRDRASVE